MSGISTQAFTGSLSSKGLPLCLPARPQIGLRPFMLLCRLLLDVQSPEFLAALPMGPEAFKAWQADCIDRVKGSLWTNWLPKCTESFRRVPPIYINGDREAYYRCVATLQVGLLRTRGTRPRSAAAEGGACKPCSSCKHCTTPGAALPGP